MNFIKQILSFVLFSFFISLTSFSQTNNQGIDFVKLDAHIQNAIEMWKIPGVAIAIVQGDSIAFAKGYGYRNINSKQKVDKNTLFAIASNTKSFTSAALSLLVSEGRIKWDDKVRKYLPYFTLYDPYVSENMTIRDLLCHRSGLETFSGDLLWYKTNYYKINY